MKDAGFVDVKARVVRIDFGELTAGPSHLESNLIKRPEHWSSSGVQLVCRDSWTLDGMYGACNAGREGSDRVCQANR